MGFAKTLKFFYFIGNLKIFIDKIFFNFKIIFGLLNALFIKNIYT